MAELDPQTQAELAALATELAANPETRKDMLKLTKKVRPDYVMPELENEAAIEQVRTEAAEKLAAMEQKLNQRDMQDALEGARRKVRAKHRASDEDLDQIENLMREKQIPDHDTAADYWAMQKRLATPTPSANPNRPLQPFEGVNMAEYIQNPKKAARAEAYKAYDELRNGTVAL